MRANKARKLGIFTWYGYRMPVPERIRLIREAGFETVLHWWDDAHVETDGVTKEAQVGLIRKEGLFIENAHLPFSRVNDLWLDTLDGQALFHQYASDIDGLAEHDIPAAVMHTTSGFEPPPVTAVGMARFRALAERAEKRGVRIALENVRHNAALTHILDSVDSPMLGLCYDAGHDNVWSRTPYELLTRYGHRLYAVHLHDNMGQSDAHCAPGQGTVNWDMVRDRIEGSAYTGSYTLEGDSAEIPPSRTAQEHLKMQYEGASAKLY